MSARTPEAAEWAQHHVAHLQWSSLSWPTLCQTLSPCTLQQVRVCEQLLPTQLNCLWTRELELTAKQQKNFHSWCKLRHHSANPVRPSHLARFSCDCMMPHNTYSSFSKYHNLTGFSVTEFVNLTDLAQHRLNLSLWCCSSWTCTSGLCAWRMYGRWMPAFTARLMAYNMYSLIY